MRRVPVLSVILFLASLIPIVDCLPGIHQTQAHAAPEPTYTFGVVPQFEQRKLYATWKPIIDELGARTGLTFNLVTTLTIQDFERAFEKGDFDFVYVNPFHLVRLHKKLGYIPLVADKMPIRGILVVRDGSSINKPEELNGKSIAFPSPNALAATLLIRADLEQLFRVNVTPLYVTTHSSVYLHVAKDLAVAGGGAEKTLREQDESLRSKLRVIYTTRSCPSHPIAAHPRVPKDDREKVRKALLGMSETAKGADMLEKVPVQKFIPVSYDDYAIMEGWGLEKYWKPVQEKD